MQPQVDVGGGGGRVGQRGDLGAHDLGADPTQLVGPDEGRQVDGVVGRAPGQHRRRVPDVEDGAVGRDRGQAGSGSAFAAVLGAHGPRTYRPAVANGASRWVRWDTSSCTFCEVVCHGKD